MFCTVYIRFDLRHTYSKKVLLMSKCEKRSSGDVSLAKLVKVFLIHRHRQAQDSLEKIFDMGSLERPSKMADLSFNKRALLMRTDGGLSG
jgi:hypothetical protein